MIGPFEATWRSGPGSDGQRGALGGLEVLPFGLLIFIVMGLIVANAWAVVDAKLAAEVAAREATRAYVEAGNSGTAGGAAKSAADQALLGAGRSPDRSTLSIDGEYARCAPVAVTVTYDVPAINVPFIGSAGKGFTVRGTHHEVIDPHASGLGREHDCDF